MASVSQPKQYNYSQDDMKSNVLIGYSVSNASLPHPHITIPSNNNNNNQNVNNNNNTPNSPTHNKSGSSNEILTSIRNRVNKFSISTRKLRSLSMKNSKLAKSISFTPNNGSSNEDDNTADNNNNIKQKMKNIKLSFFIIICMHFIPTKKIKKKITIF